MTHFSDGLRVGTAGTNTDTRPVLDQLGVNAPQVGVPTSPIYVFDVVPLTLQTNNIATSQTLSGAPATVTLTAGTGVSSTTLRNGASVYALDTPRCITITGSATTVAAISYTISGYDEYQQAMTQTITGPSSTGSVTTTKAFKYISGITATGNSTSSVAIGTSDTLGLPLKAGAFEYVRLAYNNIGITSSAGFTAAVTTTATATTGDVRGTYALQSASDGSKRFTAFIFVKDSSTVSGAFGVAQA